MWHHFVVWLFKLQWTHVDFFRVNIKGVRWATVELCIPSFPCSWYDFLGWYFITLARTRLFKWLTTPLVARSTLLRIVPSAPPEFLPILMDQTFPLVHEVWSFILNVWTKWLNYALWLSLAFQIPMNENTFFAYTDTMTVDTFLPDDKTFTYQYYVHNYHITSLSFYSDSFRS